jgi:hypothetical protein
MGLVIFSGDRNVSKLIPFRINSAFRPASFSEDMSNMIGAIKSGTSCALQHIWW